MSTELFTGLGATFITTPEELLSKFNKIKVLVFDWDGVFNNGQKNETNGSTFSEPDSMGLNMLRFHLWLKGKKDLKVYIVTGEHNPIATFFAEREHLHAIFLGVKKKNEAINEIAKINKVDLTEILFVYDDILDISASKICGVNINISRKASPMFNRYVVESQLADYITGCEGGAHAIRELSEMLISLNNEYNSVINQRVKFQGEYQEYITYRNAISTTVSKEFSTY